MKKRKHERENRSNEKYCTGRHTNNLSNEGILGLEGRELKGKKAIVNGSTRTFPFPISHSDPPSATIQSCNLHKPECHTQSLPTKNAASSNSSPLSPITTSPSASFLPIAAWNLLRRDFGMAISPLATSTGAFTFPSTSSANSRFLLGLPGTMVTKDFGGFARVLLLLDLVTVKVLNLSWNLRYGGGSGSSYGAGGRGEE